MTSFNRKQSLISIPLDLTPVSPRSVHSSIHTSTHTSTHTSVPSNQTNTPNQNNSDCPQPQIPRSAASTKLVSDSVSQIRPDANSELGYCDSNVAMYIPSVARSSPEPTLRSLNYAPTEASHNPSANPSANPATTPENITPPVNGTISPTASRPARGFDSLSLNATQVRRNWAAHLVRSYQSISRTSKLLLIISVSASFIQIIAATIILALYWEIECDSQLRVFVLLYTIRLAVSLPITILYYLRPVQRNRRSSFNAWVDRARSVMDVFAMLLFIVGNYLLYTADSCKYTNAPLYGLTIAIAVIGYIIITIPVFFCGAVIFCLPCVLVVMRVLRVGEASGVGASQELINKLPIFRYDKVHSIPPQQSTSTAALPEPSALNAPASENSPAVSLPPIHKSFLRKFLLSKNSLKASSKKANKVKALPLLQLNDEADAVCAICLADYEDSDEIRSMVCNHHYHVYCVDEWLKQNRTCPLCKRDITGLSDPPITEDNHY